MLRSINQRGFIPLAVWRGVSVVKSQKRTVVSPEPLARYLK